MAPSHAPAGPREPPPLDEAYAVCARFARDHYENFPVASRLLPAAMRPHVAAVYAFARVADDFADEGDRPEAERLALLDAWLQWLRHIRFGPVQPGTLPPTLAVQGLPFETRHIFTALGYTIRTCEIPIAPFDHLMSAFRQDVVKKRYATWDEVLDYCRRSANPVGRVVLNIAGYRDARDGPLTRSSNALCTALQLTNFWQDFEGDWAKGRLYLPGDWCGEAGARFEDLDAGRVTAAWREVLGRAGAATAELFEQGRFVCSEVRGRLGVELRLTWLGGRRILERLERMDFDVFGRRPALGRADVPLLAWRLARWRRA